MQMDYKSRYKFANLLSVVVFVAVVAGVSMLYGKLQVLQTQAGDAATDRDRLRQHEADLSSAQATIGRLTSEIEALSEEIREQRQDTHELRQELKDALQKVRQP